MVGRSNQKPSPCPLPARREGQDRTTTAATTAQTRPWTAKCSRTSDVSWPSATPESGRRSGRADVTREGPDRCVVTATAASRGRCWARSGTGSSPMSRPPAASAPGRTRPLACSQQRTWSTFAAATAPDRTWLTTEHPPAKGKLCLRTVNDVYFNCIAGCSMNDGPAVCALRNVTLLAWTGAWTGRPRNSSGISASRAIRRAVCAGNACVACARASRNALLTASRFTASRSVGELRRSWVKAVPLRGTAGAPATGLCVEDARPARARRRSPTARADQPCSTVTLSDAALCRLSRSRLSGSRPPPQGRLPPSHTIRRRSASPSLGPAARYCG